MMPIIEFYAGEAGIDLIFPLTNSSGQPLTDPTLPGYPRLHVQGLPTTPIILDQDDPVGTFHHVTQVGEWPVAADEAIHFYECHIEWRSVGGQIILSDAFEIAVVKAPSTSLE